MTERASNGITCKMKGVPNDPEKPLVTSGIRLGTPAGTTRGFRPEAFVRIGAMIARVIEELQVSDGLPHSVVEAAVRREAEALRARFPVQPLLRTDAGRRRTIHKQTGLRRHE